MVLSFETRMVGFIDKVIKKKKVFKSFKKILKYTRSSPLWPPMAYRP